MGPSNPYISSRLHGIVYYHLDNNLLQNALFVAGRLYAHESRSAEASYLLALCHLRNGEHNLSYEYSKPHTSRGTHLGCAYVFAQACLAIGAGREKEGIRALEAAKSLWSGRNDWVRSVDAPPRRLPDAGAVHSLLGKLWQKYGDRTKAVDSYETALKLNPFLWDAFLGLCESGTQIRVPKIFELTPELIVAATGSRVTGDRGNLLSTVEQRYLSKDCIQSQHDNRACRTATVNDPFVSTPFRSHPKSGNRFGGSALSRKLNESTVSGSGLFLSSGFSGEPEVQSVKIDVGSSGEESKLSSSPVDCYKRSSIAGEVEPLSNAVEEHGSLQEMSIDVDPDASSTIRPSIGIHIVVAENDRAEQTDNSSLRRNGGFNTRLRDRKRKVSGGPVYRSSSKHSDPAIIPQRRSARLGNQTRPGVPKFVLASDIGVRERKEMKKANGARNHLIMKEATNFGDVRKEHGHISTTDRKDDSNPFSAKTVKSASAEISNKQQDALQQILDIFKSLGSGYFALAHYRCEEVIQIFDTMPPAQRDTPWVLARLGRAHVESASYARAEDYFRKLRTMEPSRIDDMDIYSTILWQLKRETELSYLAHELISLDRCSPQAWCAIGNAFSLQGDHEHASLCFRRSTQLEPRFAYGFTLEGYELMKNGKYVEAQITFRKGISTDARHYNAWYGLGKVHEALGQYDFAEQHFKTAVSINPNNAALLHCLGGVSLLYAKKEPGC
ncbi:MAG: anaphase-promoting complex subunit cdc27 [Sclerophora amabilis]|nr:MAG: anaphase-promoting complex subunit cdc27 [Sclerophora amabilis]